MTRTLPWLKDSKAVPKATSSAQTERAPKRPRLISPSDDLVNASTTNDHATSDDDGLPTGPAPVPSTPTHNRLQRSARTPSTSPPAAPPEQHLMRPGYTADDIWLMVEDELYTTAKLYTSHLHHAEYQRLKRAAKERELRAEEPPPGGFLENGRKLKVEKKAVKEESEDEEGDDPWTGTQLAGLMERPRASALLKATRTKRLEGARDVVDESPRKNPVLKTKRHEDGRSTSRETSEDEDEDDLDAAPVPTQRTMGTNYSPSPPKPVARPPSPQEEETFARPSREPPAVPASSPTTKAPRSLAAKYAARRAQSQVAAAIPSGRRDDASVTAREDGTAPKSHLSSSFGDLHASPRSEHSTGGSILAKRRAAAQRARKDDEGTKKGFASMAEVPTFLI